MRRPVAQATWIGMPVLALASAAGAAPPSGDGGLVSVRLLSDAATIGPGQKFNVAVAFTIDRKSVV